MSNLRPKLPKIAQNKKRLPRPAPSAIAEEMLRKVPVCFSRSLVVSVSPQVSQYAGRCGLINLLGKIGPEVRSLRKC